MVSELSVYLAETSKLCFDLEGTELRRNKLEGVSVPFPAEPNIRHISSVRSVPLRSITHLEVQRWA